MEPFGTRTRNGLWTGQEVRGPHLVTAACCSDSAELHGLKSAGGGGGMLIELRPLRLRQWPPALEPIIAASAAATAAGHCGTL